MINKFKMVSLAAALAVGGAVSASAATVSIINAPAALALVNPANALDTDGGVWSTAPSIVSGNIAGSYVSPFTGLAGTEQTEYYTVGSGVGFVPSPAILTYGAGATNTMLSLLWGSVDSYNAIEFYLAGVLQDTVTGPGLVASGALFSVASLVEITGVVFNEVHFLSNGTVSGNDQAAFEFANVSAVPIPAGGLLLLTALGGIAALRRRKAA